jgi:raffinose/stachyose/melibiose transport system permease protein
MPGTGRGRPLHVRGCPHRVSVIGFPNMKGLVMASRQALKKKSGTDKIRYGAANKRQQMLEVVLLSFPALALFIVFVVVPVVLAAYYGFYQWKGYGSVSETGTFVGFENYRQIFADPDFQSSLKNTLEITVLSLVFQAPLAILFALLLNQKFKGRGLIRTLIFVPYVISEVIVGTGWTLILQSNGALNDVLEKIGVKGADWISNPSIALWALMIIITWKYIGFAVILLLAGMQGIPEELYEAAKVDGAGFWQLQRSITLPLLGPTIRVWAFLSIIGSLQLFDLVWIIWRMISTTAGTSTMAVYMFIYGKNSNNYGYGSAVAVIMFFISLVISLLYQKFMLNRDLDGALTQKTANKKHDGVWGRHAVNVVSDKAEVM